MLFFKEIKRVESGKTEQLVSKEQMDCYNNNADDIKSESSQETREGRRREFSHRPYEIEVEPHVKLSDKVVIPIKKFPKVLSWKTIYIYFNCNIYLR